MSTYNENRIKFRNYVLTPSLTFLFTYPINSILTALHMQPIAVGILILAALTGYASILTTPYLIRKANNQ